MPVVIVRKPGVTAITLIQLRESCRLSSVLWTVVARISGHNRWFLMYCVVSLKQAHQSMALPLSALHCTITHPGIMSTQCMVCACVYMAVLACVRACVCSHAIFNYQYGCSN